MKMTKNRLPELIKRIEMLAKKATVSVGMYGDSGTHPSGFTYVNLFKYLSEGDASEHLAARPVLKIAMSFNPLSESPLRKELVRYLDNIDRDKDLKDALIVANSLGKHYRKEVYEVFGSSALPSNTPFTKIIKEHFGFDPNAPLVATGALRSKIAYNLEDVGAAPFCYGGVTLPNHGYYGDN